MKKRFSVVSLSGLVVVGIACSPAPPPKPVVPPPPKVAKPTEPKVETPARLVLRESHLKGKVDLGSDGIVYFGSGGERWMAPATAGGTPQSATSFLEEDIATATRAADGTLLFIGESGAVYPAKKPLDAPGAKRPAPAEVRAPAAGKAAILAIQAGKTLMRTTDGGATWNKVDVGVTGTMLSLAMAKSGEGLLLVAPQRVLATTDDGATWKPVGTPGIGARRVVADQLGKLYLMGSEGNAIFTSPPGLEKTKQYPEETIDFHFPGRDDVTYATGVLAGSGLILDDHYYEVVQNAESGESEVVAEELGKPATVKTLHKLGADCYQGRISGYGSTLVAMCQKYADGTEPLEGGGDDGPGGGGDGAMFVLFKSDDAGKTWKKDDVKLPSANRTDVRLWVGPGGTVIVKGACAPRAQEGCDGHGVIRVGGTTAWMDVKVDGDGPSFYALNYAPGTGNVFAIGTAGDPEGGRPPAVFVSKDGGKSFSRTRLPIESTTGDDDSGGADSFVDPKLQYVRRIGTLAVDIEGHLLGAAIAYEGKWYGFGTKDDGATFTLRTLPPTDGLAFAGRRGFAHGIGRGFETIDGGETWSEVKAPEDEEPAVACGALGCVLGRRAIRVGWDLTKPGTPWAPEAAKPKKVVASKGVACTVSGDWQPLPARGELNAKMIDVAPGIRFAIPTSDPKDGSAKVLVVGGEPKAPVIKTAPKGFIGSNELVLFAPVDATKQTVMSLRGGVVPRGIVYARGVVPVVKAPTTPPPPPPPPVAKPPVKPGDKKAALPKLPTPTWTLEIAWWSSITNKVYKATIKDAPQKQELETFEVVPGGVHIGSYAYGNPESHLYFVQESGKVVTMPYPGRPGGHPWTRMTTRAGDRSVFVTFGLHGQTTAWWSPLKLDVAPSKDLKTPAAPTWESHTWALWANILDEISVEPRYDLLLHGGKAAVAFNSPGMRAIAPSAFGAFLKPENDASDVVTLATQKALGNEPKACPKGFDGTRVVVGFSTGTRHIVTVSGDGSPVSLATSDLVTRVPSKGGDACASTLTTLGRWGGSSWTGEAIVPLDDMTKSLLVKRNKTEWQVRAMSCSYAEIPVPPQYKDTDGFVE